MYPDYEGTVCSEIDFNFGKLKFIYRIGVVLRELFFAFVTLQHFRANQAFVLSQHASRRHIR
jgi:hypothetical protein